MMTAEARTEERGLSDWTRQFEVIVWAADAVTLQLMYVSPNAAWILGYPLEQWWSEEDFLARHLHPEDRDEALALFRDSTRRRTERSGVLRFLDANGQALPFLTKVLTLEHGEDHAPELRCLMVRLERNARASQASERERAALLRKEHEARERAESLARQLTAGEARFRSIFESPLIGLVLSDSHGSVLHANDAFLRMVGYSREDLEAGRISFIDMTPPEFQAVTRRAVEEIEARGVASTFEKEYVRKDGRRVPVMLGSVRLPASNQNATFVLDLTERKEAEAERERFFHLAPDMFCIAGMDGFYKRVNPAFTRILGWSEEELRARPLLDFIHPEDRGRGHETLAGLKRGVADPGLTVRVSCRDGGWKWLQWTAVPVPETGLIYASARDVTQQRKAEEQLMLAEQRLRTVINSGPLVLAVLDADGRFVVSEGKGLRNLGLTPGQVVGQSALEMYADEPHVVEFLRRGLQGETFSNIVRIAGLTFEVFYQPVLDEAGRVSTLSVASLNVTERVRVEAEREELIRQLMHERSILQAVLQQLPHSVYIAEAPSGKLFLANVQAEAQIRGPDQPARNMEEYRDYPGFHADGRPYEPHEWPLPRAIASGVPVMAEAVHVIRGDGSRGVIEYSATPVRDAQGHITHGVVVGVDVTARMEAEEERERLLEELKLAVSARDEFLGIASHELKTPLTPLALKLEVLARAAGAEPASPMARRLAPQVEVLRRQVKRLACLVNDLLDVSSIRAGRLALTLNPQQCDLAALVRDVAGRFDSEAKRAGCEVRVHAPAPVQGAWDSSRLEQVVTNLLANAIKYGPGHPVMLSVEEAEGRARLTVRDGGIGIAPENLQRIWGKFERAVSERHYGGLGLGLYISRQIVEALGGTVKAESALGQGATFIIELPLRDGAVRSA